MASRRKNPNGAQQAAAPLPPPERLSIYSFASRYHALRLPLWIGLVGVVLVLLHIGLMWLYFSTRENPDADRIRWYMVSIFDLDSEESFGTYFSAVSLLFIGRLVWHQGTRSKRDREIWCVWWFILAVVFYLMSIEEVIDSHEMFEEYKRRLHDDRTQTWRVEALWAAMFIGAAFVPFLWQHRWRFSGFALLGGAMYLLGSIGVDQWTPREGNYNESATYHLWVALEEALELLGPIVFLHGFLAWVAGKPTGTIAERTEVAE